MVRVPLGGRRVGGWVTAVGRGRPRPAAEAAGQGHRLRSVAGLVDLAGWAAWRWAGRRSAFLNTASPPGAVVGLPPPARGERPPATPAGSLAADAFSSEAVVVVARVPPADDVMPFVLEAARREDALVLAPSLATAGFLAARLRRLGVAVAQAPRDWTRAAAGGCVAVGARAGAWAPRPRLGAVLVLDEADEAYQEERAPTWNARDVAVERARRAGVPCVLVSPAPSLESLAIPGSVLLTPARTAERAGWPVVEVVDRRGRPARCGAVLVPGGRPDSPGGPGPAGGLRPQSKGPGPASGVRRLRGAGPVRGLRGPGGGSARRRQFRHPPLGVLPGWRAGGAAPCGRLCARTAAPPG